MSVSTAYIQCMYKEDDLQGRGEALGAVAETSGSGKTAGGTGRRYSSGVKRAAVTGMWQA